MTPSSFKLDAALLSDVGMKRKQNQDCGLSRPDLGLFMVADGMGGHRGGETASRLCVEKVTEHVELHYHSDTTDAILLHQGILLANQTIFEHAQKTPDLQGMGTTATILKISGDLATILQVGDSRAYYWTSGGLWQVTRDHSLVQEKLRAGLITREQTRTDEMKNVITRSVGYEPNVKADIYTFDLESGDHFLLCSDGLSGLIDETLMFDILEETFRSGLDLNDATRKLVDAANQNGGDDNITALLVAVTKK